MVIRFSFYGFAFFFYWLSLNKAFNYFYQIFSLLRVFFFRSFLLLSLPNCSTRHQVKKKQVSVLLLVAVFCCHIRPISEPICFCFCFFFERRVRQVPRGRRTTTGRWAARRWSRRCWASAPSSPTSRASTPTWNSSSAASTPSTTCSR